MISPQSGEHYAEPVAEVYRDAELRILRQITDSLAQGIDAPGWELLQLQRLQAVRKAALAELEAANPAAAAAIQRGLDAAYSAGEASALADVAGTLDPLKGMTVQRVAAVKALTAATVDGLTTAQNAILRGVDDIYRSVVAQSAATVAAGAVTRRQATQEAINQFLSKGLAVIQTKRGHMDISTYATMAVRTATARASIQGHLDTSSAMGLDLVTIQPGPRPCSICDSWAGKILAATGTAGVHTLPNLGGDGEVNVMVVGTLDEARSAGWGHPNDRCNIATYLPGVSPVITKRPPWDQEGYEAQQQQRAIERQIRGWKTAEATAITPGARAAAQAKVTAWQKAQRDHLEAHPFLKRQNIREQIGGNFSGNVRLARDLPGVRAAAEAMSVHPQLDKLARLRVPETVEQATKGLVANIGHGVDPNYGVNCSYVVNAVELRARGFAVTAKPLDVARKGVGRNIVEIQQDWRTASGGTPAFLPTKGGQRGMEAAAADWPVGARGYVTIEWKGGGAHIFNATKGADGKLHYFDGQAADRDASGYFARRKDGSRLWLLRTDDLTPTDALTSSVITEGSAEFTKLLKQQERVAALKRAQEAAAKAQAARDAARSSEEVTAATKLRDAKATLARAEDLLAKVTAPGKDPGQEVLDHLRKTIAKAKAEVAHYQRLVAR